MRILIGNHIDPAIRERANLRAWTQRLLWFAQDGDVVVLSGEPDRQFLAYATTLTGTDPASLRILVPPARRYGGRLLDPASLASPQFVSTVRHTLSGAGVDEVFALWPSASVSHFAQALGIRDRFAGAEFFSQGGGELSNNKATFRALAAGAGVPIPDGAVCRNPSEAITATAGLLDRAGAVVVKQAHNGAGVGNQLVLRDALLAPDRVGARHLHRLSGDSAEEIESYWAKRWDWASAHDRFPVVVEEFIPHTVSAYSEHHVADDRTWPTEMGTLHYTGRRLSHQVVPLRGVGEHAREQLLHGGTQLAETYRTLGYRGYQSADAIITPRGRVVFTEVNAQVSGSLHIYRTIAHKIVNVTAAPKRTVVEYHVPPTWAVPDFDTFLTATHDLGCAYDPNDRTGVIVSMPVIPLEPNRAQFVFCIAHATDADRQAMFDRLDTRFATHPASAVNPSDHIGVPTSPIPPR